MTRLPTTATVSLLAGILLLAGTAAADDSCQIKHVVTLMLENRAFDHMLGYLKQINPEIDGLNGDEFNYFNASDPTSKKISVNEKAVYVDPDPSHSVPSTTEQIFGTYDVSDPPAQAPLMNGFVMNAIHKGVNPPTTVMSCFNHTSLPVMSTLAMEFALIDQWHASVPGPTEVNRMFAHSATSHGASENDIPQMLLGYPQDTVYQNLYKNGHDYRIYFEEISTAMVFTQLRSKELLPKFKFLNDFFKDTKEGSLPAYTFIDPQYFPFLWSPANDQHPSHSVAEGEALIKQVYEALRASPLWNNTALVVTYDEHGGFYDHVPTPVKGVPNPDGLNSPAGQPTFNFTRLGVRVPAIIASPCVSKGQVIHDPKGPSPDSKFEHSSLSATLNKLFGVDKFLTKRDEWAGSFEHVFNEQAPRTDCPEKLPDAPKLSQKQIVREGQQPVSDFHEGLVMLADALNGVDITAGTYKDSLPKTQLAAGFHVREQVAKFFSEKGVDI